MSIIHDALKKVQDSLTKKNTESSETPPAQTPDNSGYIYANEPPVGEEPSSTFAPPSSAKKEEPPQNNLRAILITICALVAIVISLGFLFQQVQNNSPEFKEWVTIHVYQIKRAIHKGKPAPHKPVIQVKAVPAKKAETPATPSPATPAPVAAMPPAPSSTPDIPTLDIQGVMAKGLANLVLINGQVYQEGDEVAGIKIVKITLDEITINANGQEKVVKVRK